MIGCFRAGLLRLLLVAALLPALFPRDAHGASFQWQALPDRERITIKMTPNEGMPGQVARISPTGVLIPFTEVPEGLLINDKPEGAVIFQGTRPLGRALALVTTSPEFGFVVTKRTSDELVVDFFADKLGARWRPTAKAPTTEIPPDFAVPDYPPQPAPNAAQPAGATPNAAPTVTPNAAPSAGPTSTTPAAVPAGAPPASVGVAPSAAAPAPATPTAPSTDAPAGTPAQAPREPARRSAVPVVVTPDGTPLTGPAARPASGNGSQTPVPNAAPQPSGLPTPGESPAATASTTPTATTPAGASPAPAQAPNTMPGATSGTTAPSPTPALQNAGGTPMLDIRPETDTRAAGLPQPTPLASATPQRYAAATRTTPEDSPAPTPPAATPQAAATVPQTAQTTGQTTGQTTAQAPIPAGSPARTAPSATPPAEGSARAQVPAQVRAQVPAAAQSTAPAARRKEPALIPGVGVPSPSDHLSKGRAHLGTLENIPVPPEDAAIPDPLLYPDTAAQQEAARAAAQAAHEAALAEQPQKIYVDAEGNPVEPPADPAAIIPEIRNDIATGAFDQALAKSEQLLKQGNLNAAQREEALHSRADATFALHKNDLQTHFQEIVTTTQQAMAFNQDSPRNAVALLRLGYVNLKVGNLPEARSFFNRLRRSYPDDENVPLTYYYWGDYHYNRNEVQDAADQFQYVLQQYPDSRYAREAALGLARSYYRLGYYEQSFNVVEYIERRWPRFYLQYPPFLNMMGDTAFRLNKLDDAAKSYSLYVNLDPDGPEADVILTRIGDIYTLRKEKGAAREMYRTAAARFPDKDGGLVAKMRLAEEGIYDDPSLSGLFSVFDKGFSAAPPEVYREIITRHPESPLVPLAQLKLAMWLLWHKQYMDTLQACDDFINKFSNHELAPKVRETALKTFAAIAAQGKSQGTYAQMHEAWERFPVVRDKEEMLSPESRLALAVSYWNNQQPQEALSVVEPFFLGDKIPEISEAALRLVLSIYLDYQQWAAIREVARRVELWELTPEARQDLDYALALAGENLGEPENAAPIWQSLYDSGTLPAPRMANAAFFLARDAERKRNLEQAYVYGNEALNRLLEEARKTPSLADTGKIKSQLGSLMDVAEAAGRLREALEYAQRYLEYLPENDPERIGVLYRSARIYRKQGNVEAWKKGLTELVRKYPDSVYGRTAASELQGAAIIDGASDFSPTGRI